MNNLEEILMYNLPKMNLEEIENMNRSITSIEVKLVI